KALLADNDRHCVESTEQLRHTPHAMTAQGLMSGKERFFDKQDQKRLDEDWLTGFDNRDRLAFLAEQIGEVNQQLAPAKLALDSAQGDVRQLENQASLLQRVEELHFEDIDLPAAERQLQSLRTQLDTLTRPDSDLAMIKAELDQAEALLDSLDQQLQRLIEQCVQLRTQFEQAASATRKAYRGAEKGLNDTQRELAQTHFPTLTADNLG
ncbi:hypothetical protein V1979_36415, partial [Pseudomonas aeruginosa]